MHRWTRALPALVALACGVLPARAQDGGPVRPPAAPPPPVTTPVAPALHPARELTVSKCFQCHAESMWRDQRLDARGWEATLYRMVARGALWSGDEIKTMAAFLAADYGPGVPRSAPAPRNAGESR